MSGRSPRWISIAPMIGALQVGSVVKLNLNSTPWDWLVVHQGLPSSMYDESCNGTWLLLKDIYEARAWNSTNSNILESSTIQTYLNNGFLGLFDPKVQNTIKQVKIPYRSGGGSGGKNQSGADGLSCKIFLLSACETGFTYNNSSAVPYDGEKLDYFESGTETSALNKRIAALNGTASIWVLRSPAKGNQSGVLDIDNYGKRDAIAANGTGGIRPAIILPSDFRISADLITAA